MFSRHPFGSFRLAEASDIYLSLPEFVFEKFLKVNIGHKFLFLNFINFNKFFKSNVGLYDKLNICP